MQQLMQTCCMILRVDRPGESQEAKEGKKKRCWFAQPCFWSLSPENLTGPSFPFLSRSPLSSIVCFWFDSRFHVWGASHTWLQPPWVDPTRCQSWNERSEVANERGELKRKEDSNEWKERAERKGRVETKGRKYIRNERKELQRTDERIKVTNRLWEAQEVKRRGFINEVKRKDGRNEMNDLTANGRKELKRKQGSN